MTELVPRTHAAVATGVASQAQLVAAAFLAGYDGRTREAYATDLKQYFAWCDEMSIDPLAATRAHVQVFARVLEEQLRRSKSTVARKLSAVAGFYAYAVGEGVVDRSPVAHVRRPRLSDESPRFGLDRHELGRLLAAALADGPVAHALVCLLALNGLRVSEACNARVDDVDDERGHQVLHVTRKGGKRQRVALAPRTVAAIAAIAAIRSHGQAVGFGVATGSAVGHGGVAGGKQSPPAANLLGVDRFAAWRLIRRLAHTAGISKPISPHSLRHTFVTLALDAGVPLHHVQDDAGHADPRTTQRYNRARRSLERAATYRVAAFVDDTDGANI